jgi:sugar phosphate isomerase/epimerase
MKNILTIYLDTETDLFSVQGSGELCELYDDEFDIESWADAESFAEEWADLAEESGIEFTLEDLPHGFNWNLGN